MSRYFALTYAGVPFLVDRASVFLMEQRYGEKNEPTEELPPYKHQPLTCIIEELNRLISRGHLQDWLEDLPKSGKNLMALAVMGDENYLPHPHLRLGDWFYPYGASRWSVFRYLASSTQAKAMLEATQGRLARTFRFVNMPQGAGQRGGRLAEFTLESQMYMLPPRSMSEHAGGYDGLYMITLVDERYYWQTTPCSLTLNHETTWDNLITTIAASLNVDIQYSEIPEEYGQPEPDSQFWCRFENAPALLDAVAYNLGRRVIRNLDGTIELLTFGQSGSRTESNRGNIRYLVRTAGGDIFQSGGELRAGNLFESRNSVVPTKVRVTFPQYVQENDPVPHLTNLRIQPQRPSAWYEDGYGGVYFVDVPITSGGIATSGYTSTSGLIGVSTEFIHDTAKALYSGEIQLLSGTPPLNNSGLVSLSMEIARDYYASQITAALDEVYPGAINLQLDGIHDVIWTWSATIRQCCTRAIRTQWGPAIVEMQHATPPLSGFTITPIGVGGKSVAQSWHDTTEELNTWFVSLRHPMGSGDLFAVLDDAVYMPTQNRWRGILDEERIYFEGTSGGDLINNVSGVGVSGYLVTIVYRGIDGTFISDHVSGAELRQIYPNATYGANFVEFEKGQFVHPHYWTSGGVQSVRVVPQTQTVYAYTSTPRTINGVPHYSGVLQFCNTTQTITSGQDYLQDQELVWIVNRNEAFSGAPSLGVQSGGRYDGQYVGVSAMPAAPTYLVNSKRVVLEVICLPDGGLDVTYGNT
jgi:hypothetical protein